MERLGSGLSFFYFVLNLPPLTRDVTCSLTLLERKSMRRKCQMNTVLSRQQIIGNAIFLGANFQGDIVRGQLLIDFPGQILIFREQLSGVTFLGGICPWGNFPRGQLSSWAIVWCAIIRRRRAIIQGAIV